VYGGFERIILKIIKKNEYYFDLAGFVFRRTEDCDWGVIYFLSILALPDTTVVLAFDWFYFSTDYDIVVRRGL
jgi:hypothetical protein